MCYAVSRYEQDSNHLKIPVQIQNHEEETGMRRGFDSLAVYGVVHALCWAGGQAGGRKDSHLPCSQNIDMRAFMAPQKLTVTHVIKHAPALMEPEHSAPY